jgi:transposase-like protein
MKRTRKKHNRRSRQTLRWRLSRATGRIAELASEFGVQPNQTHNRKKQLLDGAAGVFASGSAATEGAANEAQLDLLYRQIGQLKVEKRFI